MLDRTQELIMQSWETKEPCMVSVVCITYNQALYVRETIESFLVQETHFPFEIIIHDDASTDSTPEIIKAYHQQYPKIIKPILQKENQYSKGGFEPSVYAAGFAKGEYVALCEGDDYWINKHKLQLQIKAMQRHPDVDFSFHSAYLLHGDTHADKPSWDHGHEQIFQPDSILNSIASFAPTPSYVVRREAIERFPEWFGDAPVGDFFWEMYGAKRGGALYIHMPLCIYRVAAPNSWTSRVNENFTLRLQYFEKLLAAVQLLKDDFSEYSDAFRMKESVIYLNLASVNLRLKNFVLFQEHIEKSVNQYAYWSTKQRWAYLLRHMPTLLWILMKIDAVFHFSYKKKHSYW